MAKRTKKKARPAQPSKKERPVAEEAPRAPSSLFEWRRALQVLLIAAAVLWIYWPVLQGDWLWDDDTLILNNGLIHDPYGIWDAWFAPSNLIDYFPLTVSVEWLEWQLWPDSTFCYHLTNIFLHVISSLLVWHLLSKFGLRLAWLGGLLFAIHPVMVESVAWIAELKNTLSMPPFLLAMCAWIDYDRRRKAEDYFLALGLFLIAMLCKTTMVMFPVVILLHAWWKRGRIKWNDLKDSAPFFVISFIISITLISFLRYGVGQEFIPLGGFWSRMACAGLSLSFYFSKCVLPVELLPIYPQWMIDPPTFGQLIPWPVLGGALYWLWIKRESWGRHALLGFGFFLINLIPFVGFRAISFMRFAWVMDHFLYLPILGLLGLAVAALGQANERLDAAMRPYAIGGGVVVMALLAFGSHQYAKIFINSQTQWTYTIHHSPDAWPAHNNLGNVLSDEDRLAEAREQYEEALVLNPEYPEAHNNLGIIFARMGRLPEAIAQFHEALRLCPELESAQNNLAKVQAGYKSSSSPK